MTIEELIKYFTKYRNNLILYVQVSLDRAGEPKKSDQEFEPLKLTHLNINRFLDEIAQVNSLLDYLHAFDKIYNGKSDAIKTIEEFLKG